MDRIWVFNDHYRVRGYEVDYSGRAPVQTLCNFMEESAGRHADALGLSVERLQSEGITWVLARLQLEVMGAPQAGEEIRLSTWPVDIQKLQFRRDFIMYGPDGQVLARGITQWVIVNLETRKLERIPSFISDLRPVNAERVMDEADWRIPAQADGPVLGSFPVRLADIDRNRHVNNVRFIDWIVESAPFSGQEKASSLKGLEIIFRAEGLYGDTVIARGASGDKPGEFIHGLFREADGQELVRGRTFWGI